MQRLAEGMRPWWPNFVAGGVLPFATLGLRTWMPLHIAAFFAFFILFAAAGLVYVQHPPVPQWSLRRWLAGSVGGALVGALITWVYPWV